MPLSSLYEEFESVCTAGLRRLEKANFNPFEPRDYRGWWSRQGGDVPAHVLPAAYNGRFHDLVVNDFLAGLERAGSTVLKNLSIVGVNTLVTIPDGVSKPANRGLPYFLEMKTGGDPPFTFNQLAVYPLICLGGHVTSFDSRVVQLGLTPGLPFPPLRILLVTTSGPGQPFGFIDYCKSIGREVP